MLSTRPPHERPDALAHRRLQMSAILRANVRLNRLSDTPRLAACVAHLGEGHASHMRLGVVMLPPDLSYYM